MMGTKTTQAAPSYQPHKNYKLSEDGKTLMSNPYKAPGSTASTAPSTPAYTIVDENADYYFVVYYQLNGARKTYLTTLNVIGKDLVEGAK